MCADSFCEPRALKTTPPIRLLNRIQLKQILRTAGTRDLTSDPGSPSLLFSKLPRGSQQEAVEDIKSKPTEGKTVICLHREAVVLYNVRFF